MSTQSVIPVQDRALAEAALVEMTSRILKEIHKRSGLAGEQLTLKKLSRLSGLGEARIRAILYPDSQSCAELHLSEIQAVLKFARRYAGQSKDNYFKLSVLGLTRNLSNAITVYIDEEHTEWPHGLARFLLEHLRIEPRAQREFSDAHSGHYLLVRFDIAGGLVLSKMEVFESTDDAPICRFRTIRNLIPNGERIVDGYIYCFGLYVYAIGRIDETSAIRCTILSPTRNRSGDMEGLRLGISVDGGPFAHRLYCRYLGRSDPTDRVRPYIQAWDLSDDVLETIKVAIPDVENIIIRLKHPCGSPHGMVIPPVR